MVVPWAARWHTDPGLCWPDGSSGAHVRAVALRWRPQVTVVARSRMVVVVCCVSGVCLPPW